jgi:hypothetical protein
MTNKKNGFVADEFPELTMRYLAAVKANAHKRGWSKVDAEDMAGDAALAVVRARSRGRYNPMFGACEETFYHGVIDASVKDCIRASMRLKRTNLLLTLDKKIVDLDGGEGGESEIDHVADECDNIRFRTELRLDVETVVAMLTPVQRKVCKLLMSGALKRDLPELAGITEYEFKQKILPSLAKAFREFQGA